MYLIQHISLCVYEGAHAHVCERAGQRSAPLPFTTLARLACEWAYLLPVLGLQTEAIMPSFLHGFWVWNSGSQACTWVLSLLSWVFSPLTLAFSEIYEEPLWFTREKEGNYFFENRKTVAFHRMRRHQIWWLVTANVFDTFSHQDMPNNMHTASLHTTSMPKIRKLGHSRYHTGMMQGTSDSQEVGWAKRIANPWTVSSSVLPQEVKQHLVFGPTTLCLSIYLKGKKVCLFKAPDINVHISFPLRPQP